MKRLRIDVPKLLPVLMLILLVPTSAGVATPAVFQFNTCGVLVAGVTCPLIFRADSGVTYTLENTGIFTVGSYVRVIGELDILCVTACGQGSGCIRGNTIESCVTANETSTWGNIKALYR